ncbi:thioredoxin fold related to phosducin [Cryptosporidium sp. chipmunk genotype I]|uniref:thioredoxin fold related to phosducin n=1 Tax=Cryptosporidium sp. chipmunk genotype I TaxID=1280935 RepID=UPI00351A0888|nr:thioredoxin fold related to phosducin [Cryptosporidium sp. chipmunk genotype I]
MDSNSINIIKKVLEESENIIDEEIRAIDSIQNDENELNRLREKRIKELKKEFEKKRRFIQFGHGRYDFISDEKEFFDTIKNSENVICHFSRPSTLRCEIFDHHLEIISKKHLEAKFIKINAEKSHFVCNNLNISILPTIALIKNSKLIHKIVGFEELSSRDDFTTTQLEELLVRRNMIQEP